MTGEGSLDAPTREIIHWQRSGFHRSGEAGCGDAPRLRHLSWLPALLQSLRFLSAPVRPDRHQPRGRCRAVKSEDFKPGRRSLHALRHVLHDQMPLCAAASLQLDFPASDAAPPRRRGEAGHRAISRKRQLAEMDRNGTLARFASPLDQLGVGHVQQADARLDGKDRRHIDPKATLPKFHSRTFVSADKGDPITSNHGRARFRQAQGRALCHLLRQLQQARHRHGGARACSIISAWKPASPIPAAAACRSWNRPNLARVAENAAKVSKELVQADRRGLRHRRADGVLRVDAEIRMGADRVPTMRT